MEEMHAVRLHEIRKAAGATNARHRRDLFVQHFALFNQLEIKREHGKIAATRAPRWMIGCDFFFGQTFAFGIRQGCRWSTRDSRDVAAASRNFSYRITHKNLLVEIELKFAHTRRNCRFGAFQDFTNAER